MLCQSCKKQEATIHYFESINGQSRSLNLCEECAAGKGIESFGVPMVNLEALLKAVPEAFQPYAPTQDHGKACVSCGMTYADYRHNPALACPACLDTFGSRQELRNRLKPQPKLTATGSSSTARVDGAVPYPEASRAAGLKRLMDRAVELEQFEEAARLRDLIRHEESSAAR